VQRLQLNAAASSAVRVGKKKRGMIREEISIVRLAVKGMADLVGGETKFLTRFWEGEKQDASEKDKFRDGVMGHWKKVSIVGATHKLGMLFRTRGRMGETKSPKGKRGGKRKRLSRRYSEGKRLKKRVQHRRSGKRVG